MKEKFKVGDIIEYKKCGWFGEVKIIGYIVDSSITDALIPIGYYRIIVLRENKKHSLRNGEAMYVVSNYHGTLTKLY